MPNIENLEKRIKNIEKRNSRVEFDKAWEVSNSRKIILTILTYIVISLFLLVSKIENPFLNALIPSVAFLISTLSLPYFKKIWGREINKK
jgi:hypothetical protein